MKRVLVRTYRNPFLVRAPEDVLERQLMGGTNAGNLLFSQSAVKTVMAGGVDVTCMSFEKMRTQPDRVNDEFDHLVLPFANAFRPGFLDQLHLYTEFFSRLSIPITVLGIGAQSDFEFSFQPLAGLENHVRAFAKAVLERSPTIGVRGEFTANYLNLLGFSEVDVIGCPSMFFHGHDVQVASPPDRFDHTARVAFNMTPNVAHPAGFIDDLFERYPQLVYFPQNEAELSVMMWGRRADGKAPRRSDLSMRLDHPLYSRAEARFHVDPTMWLRDLGGLDFSFGTRIHGNLAAVLGGTPAHVLAHDSRTRELAEYFEIPYTHVRALAGEADLNTLVSGHDYQAVARGHRARFDRYLDYLGCHGLPHAWDGSDTRDAFDERMARIEFPPPVQVGPRTDTGLLTRIGWLKYEQEAKTDKLERRVDSMADKLQRDQRALRDLHSRLDRQREQVDRDHEKVARQRARSQHLAARADRLEARVAQLESTQSYSLWDRARARFLRMIRRH